MELIGILHESDCLIMTNVPTVMHKMQEQIVSGAAVTSITFSNLNINLDDIYIIHCTIKNVSVGAQNARIYVNGDTTVTNYYSQLYNVNNAVFFGIRLNTPVFTDIAATGNDGYAYSILNIMLDIRGITRIIANSCDYSAANVKADNATIVHTVVQANITSITIDLDAANSIGIGSQFILLRLNRYG